MLREVVRMRSGYFMAALMVLGMVVAANALSAEGIAVIEVKAPAQVGGSVDSVTKLVINPMYKNIQLKPGEEEEFRVKVKNREDRAVELVPKLQAMPFGEYMLEEDWVTISPTKAVVQKGEEQEFTIKVSVPGDAEVGSYNAQITFTNDTMPSMPYPYPRMANALTLSVNVWKPPTVIVSNNFIHDRVEAGKTYEYVVTVENRGNTTIPMKPKFGDDRGYRRCAGMYCPGELEEDWVTISAPESVKPNSRATVKISVKLPEYAKGQYEGRINLNIDDPSRPEWRRYDQMVTLSLQVWQKPSSPYEKEFTVKEEAKMLSVEVSVSEFAYQKYSTCGNPVEEPSFKVWFLDSESQEVELKPAKTVIAEAVNLGSWAQPPWEAECSAGMYTVERITYKSTYTIENPKAGTWHLYIMPEKAQKFEYTIEVE
jgi:hypothetical protein